MTDTMYDDSHIYEKNIIINPFKFVPGETDEIKYFRTHEELHGVLCTEAKVDFEKYKLTEAYTPQNSVLHEEDGKKWKIFGYGFIDGDGKTRRKFFLEEYAG